jgi:hypothetical protein
MIHDFVSFFPKVIVVPTGDGNFRGSCSGHKCNTVAVVVGDAGARTFKREHDRCPDEVVRL